MAGFLRTAKIRLKKKKGRGRGREEGMEGRKGQWDEMRAEAMSKRDKMSGEESKAGARKPGEMRTRMHAETSL